MEKSKSYFTSLLLVTLAAVVAANYYIFMLVPTEKMMGAVQRVFYFHVATALACYLAFGAVFIASLVFLATHRERADLFSSAAGEVGFVLCTIVLITGMIWGHSAWNTWFRWEEPRLVTFLVLWLIFLSFTLLRNFGDPQRTSVHASILGLLGGASVPIVYISIKFLPQSARLHPEVIEHGGLRDPSYWQAFWISVVGMVLLGGLLTWLRYRVGCLELARRHAMQEGEEGQL